MKRTVTLLALGLACAFGPAHAADAPKPPAAKTAQGQRMKDCSATAKEKALKGDERKAFMGECLKKKG